MKSEKWKVKNEKSKLLLLMSCQQSEWQVTSENEKSKLLLLMSCQQSEWQVT